MDLPHTPQPQPNPPAQAVQVFAAEDLFVTQGVNQGDAMGGPDEVVPDDLYELALDAQPLRLALAQPVDGGQRVAPGTEIGAAGAPIALLARHTLMAPDGDRVEVLVLELGGVRAVLPLSAMVPRLGYALVASDARPGDLHLSDHLSLSFARGTLITLGDGSQRPVESLAPGQAVLTRDHGRQPIRWIGQSRQRAQGRFAPVVIAAGTLGNSGDLILGQHHRVFLYHRRRLPGVSTAEVLVQARHLVDDQQIYIREGGWTDYFSLVFDRHEIIYAEGVPSESLLVTDTVVSRLPPDVAGELRARFPGLAQTQHFGTEASRQALDTLAPAGRRPPP